ncbi:MAG: DUF6285 domain-containing protein [Hyphomonadaceae bacterium]|nr:DUF6285 domain-containing protein [Hyphomonadaceae bacterium]
MTRPSPFGQPDAAQLLEAAAAYLEKVALPHLEGHAAFHGKVAVNVLHIVAREIALGPPAAEAERTRLEALLPMAQGDLDALRRRLCDLFAAGDLTLESPGVADHLLVTAADRVRIEQPGYASLKRL